MDRDGIDKALTAVRTGDAAMFAELAEGYRRELHVHCYRMLGSLDDADDAVQESLLRAWRWRNGYEGRSPFRAWLYRIATNVCLDELARRPPLRRRMPESDMEPYPPATSVPWLEPYPDHLLAEIASDADGPEKAVIAGETIELRLSRGPAPPDAPAAGGCAPP